MIFPVVRRELQLRARSRTTRYIRVGAAAVGVAIAMVTLSLMFTVSSPSQIGRTLFGTLSWLSFIFCLWEGPRKAADSLSEEKRNGTLGLLFLTDLGGADVLLGKLAAASLDSLYGLLAAFPALALPLLVGGVTGAEFWRLVLALVGTLFLSFSLSMCVSSISREALRSLAGALILLLLVVCLPVFVHDITGLSLIRCSPYYAFHGSLDAIYRVSASAYWISLAEVLVFGLVLLIMASFLLKRSWRAEPMTRPVRTRLSWALLPPKWLLNAHPIQWLAARAVSGAMLSRFLAASISVVSVVILNFLPPSPGLGLGILIAIASLHLICSIWIGAVASQVLWREKDAGALELLLCCPVSTTEIVDGFSRGLRWAFEWPIAFVLAVETFLAVYFFCLVLEVVPLGVMVFLVILTLGTFISEYYALGWFGLWMGLTTRKQVGATSKTLLWVTLLPLLLSGWCAPLWVGGAIVKNLVFITFARSRLYEEIRRRTSEPFSATRSPATDRGRLPPVLPNVAH